MKLRRLRIERLPGIDAAFEFVPAGDGFHVVYGPNGIGKSSICRAIEALLWEERGPNHKISLTGEFEIDGDLWRCEREGSKIRWQRNGSDSVPPNLPSQHLHHCFFLKLKDLIDPSGGTKDVAVEIQRQMSGGFNLPGIVSEQFDSVKPRAASGIRRAFDSAVREVLSAKNNQIRLQSEADQIDTLNAKLEQAEKDQRRLDDVETAKALARRRSDLAELSQTIATFPESLDAFIGDEQERVKTYQKDLERLNNRHISLIGELQGARSEKTDSALEMPIDSTQLATWRKRGADLQRIELELRTLEENHRGSVGKLRAALEAAGGGNVEKVELDLEDHSRVFAFLRLAQTHETKTTAIEERIRLIEGVEPVDESQEVLDQLNDGVNALRAWLRAPDPDSSGKAPRHRWPWLIGAAFLVASGAALAIAIHPGFAIIAGVGVGAGIALLIRRSMRTDPNARMLAEADFKQSELEEPGAWDLHEVAARLRELERKASELDAKRNRAGIRVVEVQDLKNKRDGFSDDLQEIETRRLSLLKSLNIEDIEGDAELVDLARAFDQLRQARIDEQNVAGKVEASKEQYNSLLSDLNRALGDHGETKADDAAAAISGIEQISVRDSQLRTALSNEERLLGENETVEEEIKEIDGKIEKIFSDIGLERNNVHGLASLTEQHPAFREFRRESDGLEAKIELDCERLATAGEEALADTSEENLDRIEIELSSSAEYASQLRDQIAEIKADVRKAEEAHDVERLIETRDAAMAQLEEQRDVELFERVGQFLVHKVEQEHEKIQMPRVLLRARELFSAFTHNGYEIRPSSNADDARLIATDLRTQQDHELAELSDGTRIQLLLASRLAFAEEVERGSLMPLFLDEALDQSDPARYHEMVKSLGRVVEDQGRQIFYFTSDPVDLVRIQAALAEEGCSEARSTDLGLLRGQAASVTDPVTLRIEPRTPITSPGKLSADEYAVAIGVRPLDPGRGPWDQNLFYLLWDDLNLLRALLEAGVKWVGQWRNFTGSNLAEKLRAEYDLATQLDLRVDLFVVFCELWNQGRGRPVDRDAIEESDAISERFVEDVIMIADEKNGDGNGLIEMLRARDDQRLKGFRDKNTDALEQYFRKAGYIDDRPVLSEPELHPLVMASPPAAQLPDDIPGQCISRWWALGASANKTTTL